MYKEELVKIKLLLANAEYLSESLVPLAYFSIENILGQLKEYSGTENIFELVKLESSIISFCNGCRGNKDLSLYIAELERLLTLGTIKEVYKECEKLFQTMYELYMERYQSTVMAMEVRG